MHHGVHQRLTLGANRVLRGSGLEIHFTPRLTLAPILQRLPSLGSGSRVRIVASHLSGRLAKEELIGLVQRGADLEVLAEQDERRVPPDVVKTLHEGGVNLRRVVTGGRVPMHDKFVLIERGGERELLFGSSHWTKLSLHRNREIHVISRDPALFERFAERWETLRALADG
jgi:phosphatidylserine/phosphatidylglycerophosphate/cardiolipin synthase-like enzyme